jgi:ABC-type glutathione transport system ATPase component
MTLQTINSILGTSYAENDFNISVVSSIADITDAQVIEYKNTQMALDTGKHILKCLKRWYKANGGNVTKAPATNPEPTPETIPTPVQVSTTPAPAPTPTPAPSTTDPAAMLTQAIQAISAASISEARVMELINKALENQEPKKTVLEVKTSRGVHEIPAGLTHHCLKDVLNMIESGERPYLFGPAGTGKTELARQVAQALGLDFYFTGKISD